MERPTQLIYDQQQPVLVLKRAVIRVVSGPDQGSSCALKSKRVRVGAAEDNDLTLTDAHASRHHLEFRVDDRGYLLRDLGSTNGTFFKGARIQEAVLGPEAEVRLGSTVIRLELGDAQTEAVETRESFGDLVGGSSAMQRVYGLLAAVAPTDATVLIEGETGTGKELVARALHMNSPRAKGAFAVLDCGAMPSGLIESELFGHEQGAFTGAVRDREGLFERARGGTAFLDEVGELPLEMQTRLLRVLDRREVKRVGGNIQRRVDVRVVAATNRHLVQMVKEKAFRDDLYYRLAVMRIELPPLRERREDIPLLARQFLWEAGCAEPDLVLKPELLELFMSRQWRGNVRELRNAIERATVLAGNPNLELPPEVEMIPHPHDPHQVGGADLPLVGSSDSWLGNALPAGFLSQRYKEAKEELINRFEELYLERLIGEHGKNLSRIARDAGVDRQIIRRMMQKHGLDRKP
jgi:DNA-binding NtrC family response regulator